MPLRRCLVVVGLAVAAVAAAAPATASCAAPANPPRLSDADSVFAGEVVGLSRSGTTAQVQVRDVWHGPDLPPTVVVVGGQLERGVASSADRSYTRGTRYVFFTYRDEAGILRDNACTATARLGAYRELDPPGVRPPDPAAPAPVDPGGTSWTARAAGAAAVLAAGGLLLLSRRRGREA